MTGSVRGFLPWIAFAALSGTVGWETGAITAVLLSLVLLQRDRRAGRGLDENVIELSAAVFFVVIAALAAAAPHSPLRDGVGALSSAWLAVTAWGSLAIARPFTMGIARRSVPEHFWDTPQFRRANNVITAVWAASFTVTALAAGAVDLATPHAGLVTTLIQFTGFVVPAVFTVRYQQSRRRAAAQARQQDAVLTTER
ncbi:hypothetical protein [Streptacidiphilus jiangxiensis]|uniref:Intracellular septation protein A n=1 Tax=Streptacidiphilus jiangxiensis TaxID=235985 RepID=A0A1H7NXQ0_STRJI|nr:hypothetical protein [Streptacidiphilus jiangxiensis]SEL28332.1 hypothetical protein SAMN05414137_107123 [Streptacidiphilus jiangxiensis]